MISTLIRAYNTSQLNSWISNGFIESITYGNGFYLASTSSKNSSYANFGGLYLSQDGVDFYKTSFVLPSRIEYLSSNIQFFNGKFFISFRDAYTADPWNNIYTTEDGINYTLIANIRATGTKIYNNNLYFYNEYAIFMYDINTSKIVHITTLSDFDIACISGGGIYNPDTGFLIRFRRYTVAASYAVSAEITYDGIDWLDYGSVPIGNIYSIHYHDGIYSNGRYHTRINDTVNKKYGIATSIDGINWEIFGNIINLTVDPHHFYVNENIYISWNSFTYYASFKTPDGINYTAMNFINN